MSEATSTPDPLLLVAAGGALFVCGFLALAAMLTPHVRAWWSWRTDKRSIEAHRQVGRVLR